MQLTNKALAPQLNEAFLKYLAKLTLLNQIQPAKRRDLSPMQAIILNQGCIFKEKQNLHKFC